MRIALLLLLVSAACNTDLAGAPDSPPASVRERLQTSTRLMVAAPTSSGAITAKRRVASGWEGGAVTLQVDSGELSVSATTTSADLGGFAVGFQPIEIPSTVFGGHMAEIRQLRVELVHPLLAAATWTGDDEVTFSAMLDLGLTWTLALDGKPAPLGSPKLPPVPVEITLTGDGEHVSATLHAMASGELWSWADLVKLEDLELTLDATTI